MKPLWHVLPLNRTEVIRIIFKSEHRHRDWWGWVLSLRRAPQPSPASLPGARDEVVADDSAQWVL